MASNSTLNRALAEARRTSEAPGAAAFVGRPGETLFVEADGFRQLVPARRVARLDTIYDLASLTKVVATTTAVMKLVEEEVLRLDFPVVDIVPMPAFSGITLRHLITHTAGFIPFSEYARSVSSIDEILQRYGEEGRIFEPGERRIYSDAGFMLLARAVELTVHESFDAYCRRTIFEPLEMSSTAFNPPESWNGNCAATEDVAWRGGLIRGVVHDDNAYAVGGFSGHAGLFSTVEDLARFCSALLEGRLLTPETLREMTRVGQVEIYPWQGLGWELDPWSTEKKGHLPSRTVFGHSGWTGTSIWIDRETKLFAILLSNTCHPSREKRDNHTLRGIFHKAVADTYYPGQSNTHTGLDRQVNEQLERLRGDRIALLSNSAAVDQLGRPILDVFALAPEIDLRRIYSPEHGFLRTAEAGQRVPSQFGAVPIVSLYGDRKAPSLDELAKIDVLVVDLQDVGARYYTYIATMKACLEACATAGVRVLILDRPNPLGGAVLEGPIAKRTNSLVCWGEVPIRHGMTLGEAALFLQQTAPELNRLNLTVSELDAWRPERLFNECALPWIAPSPNIPTPETALAYVGMCLFEGTNLNEGRGTERPFLQIGAPWLNSEKVLDHVRKDDQAGFELAPLRYTPVSMPGRSTNPMYSDTPCNGVRLKISDPHAARPFRLAVALLAGMVREHRSTFEWKPFFDTLAGSDELRLRIEAGDSAALITGSYEPEHADFNERRPKLYSLEPWERDDDSVTRQARRPRR